jgi:molybdopterin-binding protein
LSKPYNSRSPAKEAKNRGIPGKVEKHKESANDRASELAIGAWDFVGHWDLELGTFEGTLMPLSARNQFKGKIVSISKGAVMAEVVIDIGGGHQIVSLISTSSAKRLKLAKGKSAVAVIKATEVIVSTDE